MTKISAWFHYCPICKKLFEASNERTLKFNITTHLIIKHKFSDIEAEKYMAQIDLTK